MRWCFRYGFLFTVLIFSQYVSAQTVPMQKEANVWYFGNFLGLDFNNGTAVPLNDGKTNTIEGVATISNSRGQLLFYSDGITVWNRQHQVMPNGTGLLGHPSSTQSGVIVPKIGDTTRYYLFTVDALGGANGLRYSVVNMTLDGGKGDLETKNVPLVANVTEKVTAVRHCNNRDVWVLAHKTVSDAYYAFLVDPSGVNTTPVISNTGALLPGVVPPSPYDSSSMGYLKASPDGKKIAAAHWTVSADVSDFDNATGVVSNSYSLFQPGDPRYLTYGIEFSPNSKLVYTTVTYKDPANASHKNALLQYDVSLATPPAVRASRQIVGQNSDPIQTYAALQVAPDGKMYMAKNTYTHIAAVSNPNVYGTGCGFVSNAVQFSMPNQKSSFGLPTFIQSYFYPPDSFTYTVSCPGSSVAFNYVPSGSVTSVKWNFGDAASGANNVSTLTNPTHTFSAPGTYPVELIKFTNCGTDTLRRSVQTDGLILSLGNDTLVCGGTSILLNSAAAGSTNKYQWQDGSTNPTFQATTSGLYWVEAKNNAGCVRRDSINVTIKPIPVFSLGADTTICQNDGFVLNAGAAAAGSYLWNTGATTSSLPASAAGLYWCEANNSGCKFRDSVSIALKPSPVVNLGNDVAVCEGTTVPLDATYLNATYLWQDGSTNPTYQATQQGRYIVQVNYNGCKRSDTIQVNHTLKPRFTLGPDQYLCPGVPILLAPAVNPSWELLWQDGSTGPSFTVTQTGSYGLTATNNCGSATDDVLVSKGTCRVYVPTGFTPNGDGKNDLFKALGVETVSDFSLKIYNRWGEVVFETADKTKGWDGRIRGANSPSGVFVYVLKYTDMNLPEPQSLKGSFVLIR
jgi:gliding motility-associated-like protein